MKVKNSKSLIIGVVAIFIGILLVLGILALRTPQEPGEGISAVTVQKDGNTLTVRSDGFVSYTKDGEVFEDFWSKNKLDTFYEYLGDKYSGEGDLITGGQNYITITTTSGTTNYILGDDELIDAIEEETGGGGGGGESTPAPTAPPGGSGGTPTPVPTSVIGGGGDPECLYWRLSYCVRKRTPSPVPSSTPVEVEIREPDCEANTQTGKTVIGNDLCLPTPSPTPTP